MPKCATGLRCLYRLDPSGVPGVTNPNIGSECTKRCNAQFPDGCPPPLRCSVPSGAKCVGGSMESCATVCTGPAVPPEPDLYPN